MAVLDPIRAQVLATRLIPSIERPFAERLGLTDDERSLALVTCDIDDVLYISLDEATKKADCRVIYAHSFYAGSAHASGPLSGEIIGMLAAPDPEEARAGLAACVDHAENRVWFEAADQAGELAFLAHPIARTGSYLSGEAGVDPGTPLAYLIAPPLEATFGLDAVLKTTDVELKVWFEPPSETNFSGGLLAGEQSAVAEACNAFRDAVLGIAAAPREV